MRTLALAVLALVMVGCTTTQGRFNPNARLKGKVCTHSCSQENCCKNNQKAKVNRPQRPKNFNATDHRRGDRLGAEVYGHHDRMQQALRKLRQAVADGKLTKEEAREKAETIRKKMGEGKEKQRN